VKKKENLRIEATILHLLHVGREGGGDRRIEVNRGGKGTSHSLFGGKRKERREEKRKKKNNSTGGEKRREKKRRKREISKEDKEGRVPP